MGFKRIDQCTEVCRCAAPTILFPAAKRPAFVYNQHGFIRKETEKSNTCLSKCFRGRGGRRLKSRNLGTIIVRLIIIFMRQGFFFVLEMG